MTPTITPRLTRKRLYFPRQKRWTRAEYDCLIEKGALTPNDRLELLEGVIVNKMPQNPPHTNGTYLMQTALLRVFTEGFMVRIQSPLALGEISEPEPDVAVVAGTVRDYLLSQPTTAVLVVEVSDSTLRVDQVTKAALYARAGIAEYALLNLPERTLELRRNPGSMPAEPLGFGYADLLILNVTQHWTPLAAPTVSIAVADLLP